MCDQLKFLNYQLKKIEKKKVKIDDLILLFGIGSNVIHTCYFE